jgi:hypothetical protein
MMHRFAIVSCFVVVGCSSAPQAVDDAGTPAPDASPIADAGTPPPPVDGAVPDAASPGPFPSGTCKGTIIIDVSPSDGTSGIQKKIDGAPSGATICFAQGNYTIAGGLNARSNLTYQGAGSPGPTLTPADGASTVFQMQPTSLVKNARFAGFKFAGRGFFVSGGHSITIDDCLFDGPITKGTANAHYVYFNQAPEITLTNSTFEGRFFDTNISSSNDALDACVQGYGGHLQFDHLSFRGCVYDAMHILDGPWGSISFVESFMTPSLNIEIQGGAAPNNQGLAIHHNHVWYPMFLSTTDETKNYGLFGMSIPADQSANNSIYANVLDYGDHPAGISGEREGIEIGGHDSQVHDNDITVPVGVDCVVAAKGWNIAIFDNKCSTGSKPFEGEPGPGPGTYGNTSNNGPTVTPSFAPLSSADAVRAQAGNPLDGHCAATSSTAPRYYVVGASPIPIECK